MTKRPKPRVIAVASTLFVAALALLVWRATAPGPQHLQLGDLLHKIDEHQIAEATIFDGDNSVGGKLADGSAFEASYPSDYTERLTQKLLDSGVDPKVDTQSKSVLVDLLLQLLPVAVMVGAIFWLFSSMQGGGRAGQFGKAKARQQRNEQPRVTFADVAGCGEAIEELAEIKDFLQNPAKFQSMGAKIPKGVLLFGPPGTGKTLLARAVAGEADAPFYSISGSDFVEMFVGVGASRVRDLFEQAKASVPAIIFVDEIDAVGRHRGAGLGGGHDEREQTLNQLLVEMDGFDVSTGVIMIAATNRPDILDPALLRPGRFDRQIVVDRPDLEGRRAILTVHATNKPLADDVDLDVLARRTPGFTGADLANMVNEGAILAARHGETAITMHLFEESIDRVMAGPERKTRVMSEKEKQVIAYHEAGHALVGHVLPNTDPIHKVSIIARGRALGWTLALPTEDRNFKTRSELRDSLAMLMGGRTAEELIFGDPTTGAQNDIERATEIARAMVTQYGMSDLVGPQQLGQRSGEVFLGKDLTHEQNYSDEMAARIDAEVRRLLDEAHAEAREILDLNRAVLDRLAEALVEHETLGDPQLSAIFAAVDGWDEKGSRTLDPEPAAAAAGFSTAMPATGGPGGHVTNANVANANVDATGTKGDHHGHESERG